MGLAESRTVNVVWKLMPNEHHFFLWMFILSWIQATVGTISSEHSVNWKKKKLDLLSQRGRAMLRVCIASIQRRAQSFIISCFGFRYTMRTIKFFSVLFSSAYWSMLHAVTNKHSKARRRLCDLHCRVVGNCFCHFVVRTSSNRSVASSAWPTVSYTQLRRR